MGLWVRSHVARSCVPAEVLPRWRVGRLVSRCAVNDALMDALTNREAVRMSVCCVRRAECVRLEERFQPYQVCPGWYGRPEVVGGAAKILGGLHRPSPSPLEVAPLGWLSHSAVARTTSPL